MPRFALDWSALCWVLVTEPGRLLRLQSYCSFNPVKPCVFFFNVHLLFSSVDTDASLVAGLFKKTMGDWSLKSYGPASGGAVCPYSGDTGAFFFLAGQPFIPSQGSFILSQGCVVRNISNDDSNAQCGEGDMLGRSFICPLYVFARPYSLTLRAGAARWSHKTHLTQLGSQCHPPPPAPHSHTSTSHIHTTILLARFHHRHF